MAMIISASINLAKIDKSKIIEGKNGSKYYNLDIAVNNDIDQYGNNVSVTDKQTKEERKAKEKKSYLGNGRVVWMDTPATQEPVNEEEYKLKDVSDVEDDLPF